MHPSQILPIFTFKRIRAGICRGIMVMAIRRMVTLCRWTVIHYTGFSSPSRCQKSPWGCPWQDPSIRLRLLRRVSMMGIQPHGRLLWKSYLGMVLRLRRSQKMQLWTLAQRSAFRSPFEIWAMKRRAWAFGFAPSVPRECRFQVMIPQFHSSIMDGQ